MPIISTVGRRSPKMRLLIGSIYAVLIIGSITMIYPFTIMVATSLSSQVDYMEYRLIPRYFYNDDVLWMKYVAEKYGIDDFEDYRTKYGVDYYGYERIVEEEIMDVPHFQITPEIERKVKDWDEFKLQLPSMYKGVYFVDPFRGGIVQMMYQQYLKKKYHRDIEAYNRKFNEGGI